MRKHSGKRNDKCEPGTKDQLDVLGNSQEARLQQKEQWMLREVSRARSGKEDFTSVLSVMGCLWSRRVMLQRYAARAMEKLTK